MGSSHPHRPMMLLIVGSFLTVWIGFHILFGPWLGTMEVIVWNVSMLTIALTTIIATTNMLNTGIFIISTYLGEMIRIDAPIGNVRHGVAGTHFVVNFPPILAKGYIFPLPVVTIPFEPIEANTMLVPRDQNNPDDTGEDITPVRVYLNIQIIFSLYEPGMEMFIRRLPVLGRNRNLAKLEQREYKIGMNDQTGQEITVKENLPCVAKVLQESLQRVMDEAVSRALERFPISKALYVGKEIEMEILKNLAGTIFEEAGLVTSAGEAGPAVSKFDLNLGDVALSNPDAEKAISSATTERFKARGVVEEAIGKAKARKIQANADAEYLDEIAKRADASEGGKLALASETMRNLPEGSQLITTPDVLDAVVAKVLQRPK